MKLTSAFRRLSSITKYVLFLLVIMVIALEIILRIYHPLQTRIKGGKIILPASQTITYKNSEIPVLDKEITIRYNSLGLRGPEKPVDYKEYLSVITIGGSTTACWNISEDKTWPSLLYAELGRSFKNVWLNNAGVSGHSSYGHLFMLKDHILKLRPKVIIFLIGINDIDRTDIDEHETNSIRTVRQFVLKYSETCNLVLAILRNKRAIKHGLTNSYIDLTYKKYDSLVISKAKMNDELKKQEPLVMNYRERVRKLIDTCIKSDIYPILLTQPVLFGDVIDSVSKVNLGNIKQSEGVNGTLYDKKITAYNDVLKQLSVEYNIPCIDLASMLPKNSRYYFDFVHYTNDGTQKIAELISPQISSCLSEKFPEYRR